MVIFCENSNIKYVKSSPYHPEINGSVEIIHRYECEFLEKKLKSLKEVFDLEIALEEFVFFHNNKKHSITKYTPVELRHIGNIDVINEVLSNIIKAYSYKIRKSDKNIKEGCYVLLSTKIYKKGNIYKEKNEKGKHLYRIPGIFIKYINSNTASIKVSVNYENYFKINDIIKCDIKILNWVEEFVYNYYMDKISNNYFLNINNLFDKFEL